MLPPFPRPCCIRFLLQLIILSKFFINDLFITVIISPMSLLKSRASSKLSLSPPSNDLNFSALLQHNLTIFRSSFDCEGSGMCLSFFFFLLYFELLPFMDKRKHKQIENRKLLWRGEHSNIMKQSLQRKQ